MAEMLAEYAHARMPRSPDLVGEWVNTTVINTQRFLTGRAGPDHVFSDSTGFRRSGGKLDWQLSMQRQDGRLFFVSTTLWAGVERSPVSFNPAGEATFTKDYGGDAAYPYRCRAPARTRLICVFDDPSPGHAVEFRRVR